jgi:hypothetical protein
MKRRQRIVYMLLGALATWALVLASPAIGQPDDDDDVEENGDAGDGDGDTGDDDDDGGDDGEVEDAGDEVDVDALRQEYLALRDKLFQSKARAATVATALYSSKLRVYLDYTTGRHYTVTRATVRLDGANIYDDTDSAVTNDKAPRFDGYVAPGRHELAVHIEAVGNDDDRFKSVIDNTFTFQAVAGKDVIIQAKAKDGGDIPYKWQRKEKGSYKLHLDVDVKSIERKTADGKSKK